MTIRRLCLVLALICPLCASTAIVADTTGEVNLFLGQKQLDLDNLSTVAADAEDGTELGVLLSFGDVEWPVMIAVDVLSSSGDNSADLGTTTYSGGGYTATYAYSAHYDFDTLEVDLGARMFFRKDKKFVPYVGGGLGLIHLKVDASQHLNITAVGPVVTFHGFDSAEVLNGDTTEIGYWVDAGLAWRLAPKFTVGVDARYSDAEATVTSGQDVFNNLGVVGEVDIKTGGVHVGVTGGYRW